MYLSVCESIFKSYFTTSRYKMILRAEYSKLHAKVCICSCWRGVGMARDGESLIWKSSRWVSLSQSMSVVSACLNSIMARYSFIVLPAKHRSTQEFNLIWTNLFGEMLSVAMRYKFQNSTGRRSRRSRRNRRSRRSRRSRTCTSRCSNGRRKRSRGAGLYRTVRTLASGWDIVSLVRILKGFDFKFKRHNLDGYTIYMYRRIESKSITDRFVQKVCYSYVIISSLLLALPATYILPETQVKPALHLKFYAYRVSLLSKVQTNSLYM